MKQSELAEMLDITPQHLSRIINGKSRPSWDLAKTLAMLTDTKTDIWMEPEQVEARKDAIHVRTLKIHRNAKG